MEVEPIVFVVDDDISVRESVEALLQHEGWQVETFESAQQFLSRSHRLAPSCVILDMYLPDLSGLDVQQKLAAEHNDMPIIFLTGRGDVPTSVRAMKAGAAEFLTKPFHNEALLEAVNSSIGRSRAALTVQIEMQALNERFQSLSSRERQVMELVVQGLLNKQVGGKLGISEITVKAHRGRAMQKMLAKSFVDLVNLANRLGLHTGQ